MHLRPRSRAVLMSASVTSLCAVALVGAPLAGAADKKKLVPLKFTGPSAVPAGVKPALSGAAGYAVKLGKADKILKRYGFKYDGFAGFPVTTQATAAVQGGSAQIVVQGQAPAVLAKAAGAQLTLIQAAPLPGQTWILGQKGTSIKNIKQLPGKTVGVGFGTNFEQGLLWALDDADIKTSSLKISNIAVPSGEAALASKGVDAYATASSLGALLSQRGYPVIWRSADHPKEKGSMVALTTTKFAKQHPLVQRAYWELYKAGLDAFKKNPDAYYAWSGNLVGVSATVAKSLSPLRTQRVAIAPESVTVLEDAVKFFSSAGRAKPFSVKKWFIAPSGKFAK